jgi:hypothetical protein
MAQRVVRCSSNFYAMQAGRCTAVHAIRMGGQGRRPFSNQWARPPEDATIWGHFTSEEVLRPLHSNSRILRALASASASSLLAVA